MKKKVVSVIMSIVLLMSVFSTVAFAKPAHHNSKQDYTGKVNIGGLSLYVDIQGSSKRNKKEPSVIFESGYGDDHTVWSYIQSQVAKKTQTLSYDRVGLGQSDNFNGTKDAKTHADQLHKLLKKANISPPYVIVAHSLGGINARVFAEKFGNELAGIVFVDSSHELQEEEIILPYLPEELHELYFGQFTSEGNYETVLKSLQQAAKSRKKDALRRIPIYVLTATDHGIPPGEPIWLRLQKDIASLSKYSKHQIVQGGHYIQTEHPDIVINAINKLIK